MFLIKIVNLKEEDQEKKSIPPPLRFLVLVRAPILLILHIPALREVFPIPDQGQQAVVILAEIVPDQEAETPLVPLKEVTVDHRIIEQLNLSQFSKKAQGKLLQVEEIVFLDHHHHNKIIGLKEKGKEKEADQKLRPTQTDILKEILRETEVIFHLIIHINQILTIIQGTMVVEVTQMVILLGILETYMAVDLNLSRVLEQMGGRRM